MDFVFNNELGHKLTAQVSTISDKPMRDLYVHFKMVCTYNTGYCPDFTLSNVDNVGPRLISGHAYNTEWRELKRLRKEQAALRDSDDYCQVCDEELSDHIAVVRAGIYETENLCDGFGFSVYDWQNFYRVSDELRGMLSKSSNDRTPSDCEVTHFRNFLMDCANYVGFYFTQVTDDQFCDDVLAHYQKLTAGILPGGRDFYAVYNEFVYDLIMCASMLYKRANDVVSCEYDGLDLVDEHKSFEVEAGDPKYPKGLYSTEIALKVFQAIR